MREIILAFVHVYRRFRLGIRYIKLDENHTSEKGFQTAMSGLVLSFGRNADVVLNDEEKQNILRYIRPLPRSGPVYLEWKQILERMEQVILRELGFSLYWIPQRHPHVFLLYFIRVLEIEKEKLIAQRAWNYCNDSCRLDLCVRYEAEIMVRRKDEAVLFVVIT